MFEIPEPEIQKRGRPIGSKNGTKKQKPEPKKLGIPYRFNTLDDDGNTMNPSDGYIERRGKYIKQINQMKKYHKLDFPNREDYEGKDIEVIHELIAKMKEHIKGLPKRKNIVYDDVIFAEMTDLY